MPRELQLPKDALRRGGMIHRPPQSSQILPLPSSSTGCCLLPLPLPGAHRGPEARAGATSRKPLPSPQAHFSHCSHQLLPLTQQGAILQSPRTPEGTRCPGELGAATPQPPPSYVLPLHTPSPLTGWHEPREGAIPITQPKSMGHKE